MHPEFFSGRTPPNLHPESVDYIDWWNEQIARCIYGFEYRGRKITGSYYFFLNFFRMEILIKDGDKKRREFFYPYTCNTDAAVFEAIEDCHNAWQTFMMFTSGGTGKTSMAASYIDREWRFFPRSYSLVTASTDTPAAQAMKFIEDSIDASPAELSHDRYPHSRFKYFASATRKRDGTVDTDLSYNSVVEKIIFGDNSGATRSKRPTIMLMEEIGNWVGGASLIDCYNASMARGKIQGEKSCFFMMIGTGGHTRNNVIEDVKQMIEHPSAYDLYLCDPWQWGKKSIFFIPAYKKAFGFYEETGIMDEAGARAKYEAVRETKKADAKALLAEKREFPFTLDECFLKEVTGGLFYPDKLDQQKRRLKAELPEDEDESILKGRYGIWEWNYKKGYPDFREKETGPVFMIEEPDADDSYIPGQTEQVRVPAGLYIGGYDGIDFSAKDSTTTSGSRGALQIKKRTAKMSRTNNLYVCRILWRPEGDINELYEQILYTVIAYNCKINIEYTKIGIKKFFEERGHGWRLLRRPKSMMGNSLENQIVGGKKDLIGTQPTPANINYGIGLLQIYVFNYFLQLFDLVFIDQLENFSYEEKGKYDLIMASLWCEVADEAEPIFVEEETTGPLQVIGWYIDPASGYKQFGIIPTEIEHELRFSKLENTYSDSFLVHAHLYQPIR